MIAGVRGRIAAIEESSMVIDLHGFLVRVNTSASTLNEAGAAGDLVELITHLIVREDSLTLYGFSSEPELELFQLLLTVTGVGPRVALNLLSYLDPSSLYEVIANEDTAALSKVPGIGKVTAGRIILDLKRKLPEDFAIAPSDRDDRDIEVIAALEALGYSTSEARNSLSQVENRSNMTVEERIIASLQNMDRS